MFPQRHAQRAIAQRRFGLVSFAAAFMLMLTAAPAFAQHDRHAPRDGYHDDVRIGYSVNDRFDHRFDRRYDRRDRHSARSHRHAPHKPKLTRKQIEFQRGQQAGAADGWSNGYAAGLRGEVFCDEIRLYPPKCNKSFRRGFECGYREGYASGYEQGRCERIERERRERERRRNHRSCWSFSWSW